MYLKKSLQHYSTLIKVKLYQSLREKIDRHRDLIYADYHRKIGNEIRIKLETKKLEIFIKKTRISQVSSALKCIKTKR